MTAADARWHRTQRDPTQACHSFACLIASSLTVMAAWSRGETGPRISLDEFRSRQLDRVGGIDLFDAKYGARSFHVPFEAWANFGPGPEYPSAVRLELVDHGATTPAGVVALLAQQRFVVMNISYGALPPTLRHDASFLGPHGIALLGHDVVDGVPRLLISDPLASAAHWHPAAPFWAAAGVAAGASGSVNAAATPIRQAMWLASVRAGMIWLYSRSAPGWSRRRWITGGFSGSCDKPVPVVVSGVPRRLARMTSGAYSGQWIDAAAWNVKITEVP